MTTKKTWDILSLTHEINEHQRQEAKKRHKEEQQFLREKYANDDPLPLLYREWDDKKDFVGVSYGIVRRWFNALEKKKIILLQKKGNRSVYDELCLKIGIYIFNMRQSTNTSLEDIYE